MRVDLTFVDYDTRALDSSLAAALEQADAVVAGTVVRQDYRISDCRRIVTLMTVRLRAVLKPDPEVQDLTELTVERWGGAAREGGVIVQQAEAGFPQLSTGGDYVLFLKKAWRGERWPSRVWRLWLGPFTTIAIGDQQRLRPLSRAGAISRIADGQSLTQFAEQVRSRR